MGFLNKSAKNTKNTYIDVIFKNKTSLVDVADVEAKLKAIGLDFVIKRVGNAGDSTEILLDVANFDMSEFSIAQKALQTLQIDVQMIAALNARIIT